MQSQEEKKYKNPVAYPPCGPVMGIKRRGIASFKGIPYAQPPVLNKRFKAPESLAPWTELRPLKVAALPCRWGELLSTALLLIEWMVKTKTVFI
jgi:para-nitrobenzyl esterase